MSSTRSITAFLAVGSCVVFPIWIALAAEPTATGKGKPNTPVDASSSENPGAAKPVAVPTKPPEQSPVPFIVRIDKSKVEKYGALDYDVDRPIDQVVLGARARGDSRTIGKSHTVMVPNSNVATFDIVFQGKTTTTTVSVKEPGVVYGRTFTEMSCTRRVVFDPKKGFNVPGATECGGTTKLVFDSFGSTRQLGQRLITRITERQAYHQFEDARRIADHDNQRDVRIEFEKEVDKSLADSNKGLNLDHFSDQLFGKDSELEFFTKSDADAIHIGIGPAGEKYAPITQLPPRQPNSPGIEIFVHASILSEPVASALKMVTPQSKTMVVDHSKIFGELKILPSSVSSSANLALQDGWLVIGLPDEPTAATAAESGPTTLK